MSALAPRAHGDPAPPFVLDGRYLVESELGRGGMGVVYRGMQLALSRPVAIKRMATNVAADPAALARFRREALAASRLAHPGIVGVFDAGIADGAPYLVMELVSGQPLDHVIARSGRLERDAALGIAGALANALAAAHAAGVQHRDVKPANVLIGEDGRARLVDFGLATLPMGSGTRVTRLGALVGTPEYLAPEVACGADPDARADVYALGVTLYEMLTGALPFEGATPMATVLAHVHDTFAPPSSRVPSLDASVDALVAALLARDPATRPANGRAAEDAIAACLVPTRAPRERSTPRHTLDALLIDALVGE